MIRTYSLSSNIYTNICESDNPQEIAKWFIELTDSLPPGAIIIVKVNDTPQELWDNFPKFEGFKQPKQDLE